MNINALITGIVAGIMLGIVFTLLTLTILGHTPTDYKLKERVIYQKAVDLGYGKWIIDTNSTLSTPTTYFQWNTGK